MDSSLSVSEVFETYAADLRRFVTGRTRDAGAADDIVQDAFVRLELEWQARRFPTSPKAWLYRVALNLVISAARRADVAHRMAGRLAPEDLEESPEERFIVSERKLALETAMQSLAPLGRTSLWLAAEGYTGREIALAIGLSEGATRTTMCRARGALRRELTREARLVA